MKKFVLSLSFLFCLLVAITQNSYTIEDFKISERGENTTYILKPEYDVNEFTLDFDATVVSEKGSFSLAWNFCDTGDCNIFHCYSNAFYDLIGHTSMVLLTEKEIKIGMVVKVVSDHTLYYQLYLNNQLKSEGYKVIERDFSRKLYLNFSVSSNAFKINPPVQEYKS